jgi:putative transposase
MARHMETCQVCRRQQVVELVHSGVEIAEAARLCGMSRAKVYKWLARFDEGGDPALEDRSRARRDPGRFEGPVAERLVELRLKYGWGPKKLLKCLAREGAEDLPAPSTVGALLARHGLVRHRQRRQTHVPYCHAGPAPSEPNARWTMDFKGGFRLGNGAKCLPFTLRDAASRKILSIRAMPSVRTDPVRTELEDVFRECGLPEELQSDNGPPFASTGLSCLSKLSVWLLKLGVVPLLSRPGKPQDNGGHERMHRDLKAETTRPPGSDASAQQRKFDAFRRRFNKERPHEALGGGVPDQHWTQSPRRFPEHLPEPEYPAWWEVRRVCPSDGAISWHDEMVGLSQALGGERVGFEPFDEGLWRIQRLCHRPLRRTACRTGRRQPSPQRRPPQPEPLNTLSSLEDPCQLEAKLSRT